MKTHKLHIIWLFGLLLLVTACDDDDYYYPSVKLEFVTVQSGEDGSVQTLIPDKGEPLPVSKDLTGSSITPNSSKRVLTNYEQVLSDGKKTAKIYALQSPITPEPHSKDEAPYNDKIVTDPVNMTSIWMGREYLNLILSVKARGNAQQVFGMIEEEVVKKNDTEKEVTLLLYHDVNGDEELYKRRAYISVPLAKYVETGITKITVRFKYYTYDKAGNKILDEKYYVSGLDYLLSENGI